MTFSVLFRQQEPKNLTANSSADELSAQHLHHSQQQQQKLLSESDLSSSIESLHDEQQQRRNNLSSSTNASGNSGNDSSAIANKTPNQLNNDWPSSASLKTSSPKQQQNLLENANNLNAALSGNCSNLVGMSATSASVTTKALNELINQQQQNLNLQRDRMTPTSLLATFQQQQLQLQQAAIAAVAAQSGCPEHPNGKGLHPPNEKQINFFCSENFINKSQKFFTQFNESVRRNSKMTLFSAL